MLRLLERYTRFSVARPAIPLLVIAATSGLGILGARRIGLDASFEALLPTNTPSVQAGLEARRRVGTSDLYVIAIRSPDPRANFRFAEAVAARVRAWPETQWAMDRIDLGAFRDRALLYMDLAELRELVD